MIRPTCTNHFRRASSKTAWTEDGFYARQKQGVVRFSKPLFSHLSKIHCSGVPKKRKRFYQECCIVEYLRILPPFPGLDRSPSFWRKTLKLIVLIPLWYLVSGEFWPATFQYIISRTLYWGSTALRVPLEGGHDTNAKHPSAWAPAVGRYSVRQVTCWKARCLY